MNNFPKRKLQRLKNYDYAQNGKYFITICCEDMRCLLATVVVGNATLGIPSEVKLTDIGVIVKTHLEKIRGIEKYVIMPNHIHMIIFKEESKESVSDDIRAFKSVVTRKIKKSIFQSSFNDRIIRDEEEYKRIWKYIDENPDKWVLDKYFCDI